MTNSNINIYIKIIFNIKIQLILNININIDLTSHRVQSLKSKYFQRLCGCWSTKVCNLDSVDFLQMIYASRWLGVNKDLFSIMSP